MITGIHLDWMDHTVSPGEDFFRYCNNAWINETEIPAGYGSWGTLKQAGADVLAYLHELMENLTATHHTAGSNEQLIADLYASGMDVGQIETQEIQALQKDLAGISSIRNFEDVMEVTARLHLISAVFFNFSSATDFENSALKIASASQGGLSFDRLYYLQADTDTVGKRAAYRSYVQNILKLSGHSQSAEHDAQAILALETELAKASMASELLTDPAKCNNKMTVAAWQDLCPRLPLQSYFAKLGAPVFDELNVAQPEFFRALDQILTTTPLDVIKAYMRFHLLSEMSPFLQARFNDLNFEFFGKVMKGTQTRLERWKVITGQVSDGLGEAVGKLYVAGQFPPEAKQRMIDLDKVMTESMREVFAEMVWMSDETRAYAIRKLEALVCNIGYPEQWRDYTGLKIGRVSFAANMLKVFEFNNRYELGKIGQPARRDEWTISTDDERLRILGAQRQFLHSRHHQAILF
jgi:putative endopeptidase